MASSAQGAREPTVAGQRVGDRHLFCQMDLKTCLEDRRWEHVAFRSVSATGYSVRSFWSENVPSVRFGKFKIDSTVWTARICAGPGSNKIKGDASPMHPSRRIPMFYMIGQCYDWYDCASIRLCCLWRMLLASNSNLWPTGTSVPRRDWIHDDRNVLELRQRSRPYHVLDQFLQFRIPTTTFYLLRH